MGLIIFLLFAAFLVGIFFLSLDGLIDLFLGLLDD